MAEPVREFSTTEPAPFITIDGEAYNLRVHTSTVAALNMRDIAEEYQELSDKRGAERTPDDDARIVEIMAHMMELSLDASPEVIEKLDDSQRGAIMEIVSKEIVKRRDPTKAGIDRSAGSIEPTESETG